MNEILIWIVDAVCSVIGYGIIAAVVIAVFGQLWPRIADMVKVITFLIPTAIVVFLVISGEIWNAIVTAVISLVVVGVLFGIYALLDRAFGVLVTEEEAARMLDS